MLKHGLREGGELESRSWAVLPSQRDVFYVAGLWWNGGRSECTGQLPHSWKSVSDLKSTATCRPSS